LSRRRTGFTLVEVLVVLVILAILAAIAIPALTGYINKAEDKKWIAQARNCFVAAHTVVIEAYADGVFDLEPAKSLFKEGGFTTASYKSWPLSYATHYQLYDKTTELLKTTRGAHIGVHGFWFFNFVAPNPSNETMADARGFIYSYYPKGQYNEGGIRIFVTYKLTRVTPTGDGEESLRTALSSASYKEDAGYEVYYPVQYTG
jgi:prepilin-type N-terminal cleavage/methylation domain-containing protein